MGNEERASDRPVSQSTPEDLVDRAYSLRDAAETKDLYRDWAASYDRSMLDGLAYVTPARTAQMLARHLADRDTAVLDVGCGTGLAGSELARYGYTDIDALDFSPEMLAVAGGRRIYGKLIEADLTKDLPIADARYGALICTGTFTHAHVGAACLDELIRILAPGGLFACTIHNDVWEPMGFAEKLAALTTAGVLRRLEERQDIYFETDDAPQGRYLVWRRQDAARAAPPSNTI